MVKVSVIVPVFNKEKELSKCLDSLINQTISDIEIIVVDDKSRDKSREIIDKYVKMYPTKIKKIFNKKNMGIGYTRNVGMNLAKGEYLGFVDADDYVDFNMYEDYYEYAKDKDLDIVTGYYYKFGKDNLLFKNDYFDICSLKDNKELLLKIDYGPCNKIFKRSILLSNNIFFEEKLKYEDTPFVLKMLKESNRVGHIGKAYYYYFVHGNSETTVVDNRCFDIFAILDIIRYYYSEDDFKEIIEAFIIIQVTKYMTRQRYQKEKKIIDEFIDYGYYYLKSINTKWRMNTYYRKYSFIKRFIWNRKFFLKCYVKIFRGLNR